MKRNLRLAMAAIFCVFMLCLTSCENPLFLEAAKLYLVAFDSNGGSPVAACRTDKISSAPVSQKGDAVFLGWYSNALFAGLLVAFPFEPSEDTTLYAKWKQKYQVDFVTNGGTEVASLKTDVLQNAPVTTKAGCVFAGWHKAPSFDGGAVQFPYQVDAATTLYARWTKICHVKFETNGGSEVPEIDATIIEARPQTKKEGYVFVGWSPDEKLKAIITFPYVLEEDIVLYAKWTEADDTIYKVEHYKQSLARGVNGASYVLDAVEELSGKTNSLTQAAAKSYEGFSAQDFSQDAIRADGSTVVKIYYDKIIVAVSFDANGGSGTMDAQEFFYGEPQALDAIRFERQGYAFVGWATSKGGDAVYADKEIISLEEPLVLYAKWFYGAVVTAATIPGLDLSSITDDCKIVVEGNISYSTLQALAA